MQSLHTKEYSTTNFETNLSEEKSPKSEDVILSPLSSFGTGSVPSHSSQSYSQSFWPSCFDIIVLKSLAVELALRHSRHDLLLAEARLPSEQIRLRTLIP